MELYILRHGEAGKRIPVRSRDYERSLTSEGRDEVAAVAKALDALKIKPDLIVSSPLRRSKETAEIVAKQLLSRKRRSSSRKGKDSKEQLQFWDELRPEGHAEDFYKRLSSLAPESNILCVGHEPYLTEMIAEIVGSEGAPQVGNKSRVPRVVLRKAGLARIQVSSASPHVQGELRWLLTPRLLKRLR